mgnify:CR=1 FL=1
MNPPKAYKSLFVALLGITLGCGDPSYASDGEQEVRAASAAVVGGWAATNTQIFATVEIRHTGANGGFCSGTLISPLVVVTAAHCAVVEPSPGVVRTSSPGSLQVAAGHLHSLSVEDANVRPVFEVRVHPDYDHDFIMGRSRDGAGQGGIGAPNDIALLLLASPFENVPVAPLLTREREQALVGHGDVGFVAGYGVYDLDDGLTGELYISDAVIDIIGPRELLTTRIDPLGDSCYGDSGGPLYVPTDHGDFLVGLVSRGRSDVKRDCGDGGVYTLLSAHLSWIASEAGAKFQPRMDPERQEVSFVPEGADPISAPSSRALQRADSCAASPVDTETHAPLSALASLMGLAALRRRLSRR